MKVAKILDSYRVAVTKTDGPYLGTGDILVIGNEDVVDPETGEIIGKLPTVRVKVVDVYDKFVVAETYRLVQPFSGSGLIFEKNPATVVTVNVGDEVFSYEP